MKCHGSIGYRVAIALFLLRSCPTALAGAGPFVQPVVEIEEDVYSYSSANNGAGPMWCSGATCLVRDGDALFASGIETVSDFKPLNNCRWLLFQRGPRGWQLEQKDAAGRTREPCPLVIFPNGQLFLSANPTLSNADSGGGPARPEILQFSTLNPRAPVQTILPAWDGTPQFTEHSYRSFAADGLNRELILFQNIGYTHAEWTFRDRAEKWAARGRLNWPRGPGEKNEPIRICYPDVALRNREVHFCGVSDIIEPKLSWRAFKRQLTGQEWDYDFRRLFYTWTPDIVRSGFREWVEIASREETCGWISPGDLWVAADGAVHIIWIERALDERLRPKFFPQAKQSHALNYALLREGKVLLRKTLVLAEEGRPGVIPSAARFQVTPEHRLFVFFHASGRESVEGKLIAENRLMEILSGGETAPQIRVPLQKPFTSCFTATTRAGSPPSDTLELLGQREGSPLTISYARIRLR